MASQPSNGSDNYSVDEMMARLKRNERQKHRSPSSDQQEGELVTRPDGSQVVKVRRRKRRSKQPSKETPKSNSKLKWTIVGSFIGIVILLIVACVIIIAKYNGRQFKEDTESTLVSLTGASTVEIDRLRVTPVSAKAVKTTITWHESSFLKQATFENIQADIKATSFFSSSWHGSEIVANEATIRIGKPGTSTTSPPPTVDDPYHFGSYRCHQTNIHFGTEKQCPKILNSRTSLKRHTSGGYLISFTNGELSIPNWPKLTIASGIIKPGQQECEIDARLAEPDSIRGELLLKGNLLASTDQPAILDVTAKNYAVHNLLGKLGRLVRGHINSDSGSLSYHYSKKQSQPLSFVLPFNSTELRLEGFPFLTTLKDITGDSKYVRPTINDARGTLVRNSLGTSLDNLKFRNSSYLNIDGNIHVASDGALSGTLTVGIRQSSFRSTPPAVFEGPHDGLYRATIRLSGTVHNPHDDLADRIKPIRGASRPPRQDSPTNPRSAPATPLTPMEQKERDFEEIIR